MKKSPWQKNKYEIVWHIVNSLLAGALVLLGSLTSGSITKQGFMAALIASLIVILTKLRDYWSAEEKEYTTKLFNFIYF